MINTAFQYLAESYPRADSTELTRLARDYEYSRGKEILDIAAIAADVSVDSILNLQLEPEKNEELWEAFDLFTKKCQAILQHLSRDEVMGYLNGVKGKYFEVLVKNRLNDGRQLGDVGPLLDGQKAIIAESATQPGWDLKIISESDGSLVEKLQLKATDSFAYVKEALERYPEFRIATTCEINNAADNIIKTNISNELIEQTTQEQLLEASEEFSKDLLDKTTEWGFDAVPVFPAIIIAVTEGRTVILGRTSLEEALERGAKRLGESTVFTVLRATLTALDAGIVSVPSSVAARIGWRRVMNRIGMTDFIKSRTAAILVLAA